MCGIWYLGEVREVNRQCRKWWLSVSKFRRHSEFSDNMFAELLTNDSAQQYLLQITDVKKFTFLFRARFLRFLFCQRFLCLKTFIENTIWNHFRNNGNKLGLYMIVFLCAHVRISISTYILTSIVTVRDIVYVHSNLRRADKLQDTTYLESNLSWSGLPPPDDSDSDSDNDFWQLAQR